jgi:hypothetical protein
MTDSGYFRNCAQFAANQACPGMPKSGILFPIYFLEFRFPGIKTMTSLPVSQFLAPHWEHIILENLFPNSRSLLAGRCLAEAGRNGLRPLLVKS